MRCLLFLTTLQGYSPKSERGGSGTCCCPYLFLGQRSFHENLRSWPCCSQAQHRIAAAHSSVRRTPLVGCRTCMHTYAIFMIVYPPPSRRHLTKGRGFTILLFVSAPSFLLLRRLSVRHHDRRAVHGGWTYQQEEQPYYVDILAIRLVSTKTNGPARDACCGETMPKAITDRRRSRRR